MLVTNKDLEAIDDKTSMFREQETPDANNAFSGFELEVNENDWLSTKAKLENEKSVLAQDNFMANGFSDFEVEVQPEDWTKTYLKLRAAKKRRVAYWWLSAGILILALGLFIVSRQYQGAENSSALVAEKSQQKIETVIEKQALNQTPITSKDEKVNETIQTHAEQDAIVKKENETPVKSQNSLSSVNTSTADHAPLKIKAGGSKMKTSDHKISSEEIAQIDISKQKSSSDKITRKLDGFSSNEAPALNSIPTLIETPATELNEKLNPSKPALTDEKTIEIKPDIQDLPRDIEPLDTNKKKKEDLPVTPPSKLPKTRFYVGLVNQIGSTYRKLDKQNNAKYNNIRNEAEKPFMQWTYGLEFGVKRNKTQFSIGMQATTQTWASAYRYSYKVYDSLPVWNMPHTVIIGYFLTRARDTFINEEQVVKINKVQVPFEFSQFWTLTPKLNFMGSLAGTIGFTTRTEGKKILNPVNNYLYPYSALKHQERSVSFAPTLSLGIEYQLNSHFMLQSAAYGNYSMTSRFKSSFAAKDYPYSIGLSVKLLYLIK